MSKVGKNRKGLRYGEKKKRNKPWKPIAATHEERHQIVRRKSVAGVEYVKYKPIVLQKKGAIIESGPNRRQRRSDKKWEKGQIERDRKQKVRDNLEAGKIAKQKRIEKRHEENRQKSAKRKELAKKS